MGPIIVNRMEALLGSMRAWDTVVYEFKEEEMKKEKKALFTIHQRVDGTTFELIVHAKSSENAWEVWRKTLMV